LKKNFQMVRFMQVARLSRDLRDKQWRDVVG
jgi:hypothetical protein